MHLLPNSLQKFTGFDRFFNPQFLHISIVHDEEDLIINRISGHGFNNLIDSSIEYPGASASIDATAIHKLIRKSNLKRLLIKVSDIDISYFLKRLEYKQLNHLYLCINIDSYGHKGLVQRATNRKLIKGVVRGHNYYMKVAPYFG